MQSVLVAHPLIIQAYELLQTFDLSTLLPAWLLLFMLPFKRLAGEARDRQSASNAAGPGVGHLTSSSGPGASSGLTRDSSLWSNSALNRPVGSSQVWPLSSRGPLNEEMRKVRKAGVGFQSRD